MSWKEQRLMHNLHPLFAVLLKIIYEQFRKASNRGHVIMTLLAL